MNPIKSSQNTISEYLRSSEIDKEDLSSQNCNSNGKRIECEQRIENVKKQRFGEYPYDQEDSDQGDYKNPFHSSDAALENRNEALLIDLAHQGAPKIPSFIAENLENKPEYEFSVGRPSEGNKSLKQTKNKANKIGKKIEKAIDANEIFAICDGYIDQFSFANIATACARIAALEKGGLCERGVQILRRLAKKAVDNICELSNTTFTHCQANIQNEIFYLPRPNQDGQKNEIFGPEDLASVALAFARLRMRDEELFNALAIQAQQKIQSFSPEDLANTAWAFAELDMRDEALFNSLAIQALQTIQSFSAHDLANTVFAFAMLNIRNEGLFNALAIQALQKIQSFSPEDLANTALAFAMLNIRNEGLFNALAIQAQQMIQNFSPEDLANTAGAFAALGIQNETLFNALAIQTMQKIESFREICLSSTAWAYATLEIKNEALFVALTIQALQKIQSFSPEDLANTAWAFATLDIHNEALFR